MKKEAIKTGYTVKQLAGLAGVSVRTLHLYDEMNLLKPSFRTEAGYRLYSSEELLRLQQILFYKELDFPLRDIASILNDPEFNLAEALKKHKEVLTKKHARLTTLMKTIDNTIHTLKKGMTLSHEELYEGFPKEQADAWRSEAVDTYGKDAVEKSEESLGKSKQHFEALKAESTDIYARLFILRSNDPGSTIVQKEITKHYHLIRKFWGTDGEADSQWETYSGLGDLYESDERFTMMEGKPQPDFAVFMNKAMKMFVEQQK